MEVGVPLATLGKLPDSEWFFLCNCVTNTTPLLVDQESVVLADPEAADFVLGQGGNIKIVGLDVTHSCHFTGTDLRGLQGRGRFGMFLSQITAFYLKYHQ